MISASQLGILTAQIIWYFLPALVANMAPVFATYFNWLPILSYPLDGGITLKNQPVLGSNKTIRGLLFGLIFGSITALIQYWLQPVSVLAPLYIVTVSTATFAVFWGMLLGFGALLGDAIKSFCKRRLRITSGVSWKPWDQIDVVLGVLLVTWWNNPLTFAHIITALLVIGCSMFITSYVGKILRIKNTI